MNRKKEENNQQRAPDLVNAIDSTTTHQHATTAKRRSGIKQGLADALNGNEIYRVDQFWLILLEERLKIC